MLREFKRKILDVISEIKHDKSEDSETYSSLDNACENNISLNIHTLRSRLDGVHTLLKFRLQCVVKAKALRNFLFSM